MTERQHQLLDLLEVNGSLTISELASKLYISMSTVRRDVSELEALKLVARMPQGVILLNREQGGVSLSYSLQ
ncbi:MAG: DeoR/GlpR transcriptional regulator, partial [Clostridia bacterium]|nr:DeoR/GlpR transcriptional regulator [Clostridia bacterium]